MTEIERELGREDWLGLSCLSYVYIRGCEIWAGERKWVSKKNISAFFLGTKADSPPEYNKTM